MSKIHFVQIAVLGLLFFNSASANWDQATGFLQNYKPSPAWLAKNPPKKCSNAIQLAECSHNTRTSFPDVQLMAVFTVNHANDAYHGCSYGTCCAFTRLPLPADMVRDQANSHSFFWHNLAGFPGMGTNPIADPKTGQFGYETSADGKFHVGRVDKSTMQPNHDQKYPGFKLPNPWPKPPPFPRQANVQPPCGRAGEPNKDPNPKGLIGGSQKGAQSSYGSSNRTPNSGGYGGNAPGRKNEQQGGRMATPGGRAGGQGAKAEKQKTRRSRAR